MLSKKEIAELHKSTTGWKSIAPVYEDFAHAIIAAYTAKLLAGVDIGEPVAHLFVGGIYGDELQDWEIEAENGLCEELNLRYFTESKEDNLPLYTADQLQQYAAAAAAQTREKALETVQKWIRQQRNDIPATGEEFANAIEILKCKL